MKFSDISQLVSRIFNWSRPAQRAFKDDGTNLMYAAELGDLEKV